MRKQYATYGQAGGPGQGLSRFQVIGDPTPFIPVWASGSLMTTTPAHMIGDDGSAWKYGTTVVGGNQNLIAFGDVVYPTPTLNLLGNLLTGAPDLYLGGGTFYDGRLGVQYGVVAWFQEEGFANVSQPVLNGEAAMRPTTGTVFGAAGEVFNQAGGSSVGATNLSTSVVGAGTTFTTDTLVGGYGYTPSLNKIVPGDVIGIGAPGSRNWYRITGIIDDTHLVIFPPYQQGTLAGQSYAVFRNGYGSYSRVIAIPAGGPSGTVFFYYCGNFMGINTAPPTLTGRLQAVRQQSPGPAHFMAPQTTAPADFVAQDIAYYKSFLLYGGGNAIGWSVAGFPTAIPFGATDFPALNISVIDITDRFVTFEFLGDQLIAMFRNSHYLVQATGIVPEFSFYKLPEPVGPLPQAIVDPQMNANPTLLQYGRPSCSGRATAFYMGPSNVMQLSGGVAKPISDPVKSLDILDPPKAIYTLNWDPTTDSVMVKPGGPGAIGAVYQADRGRWLYHDATVSGITATAFTYGGDWPNATGENIGNFRETFLGTDGFVHFQNLAPYVDEAPGAPLGTTYNWIWAAPIICLSQVYAPFKFGGFQIWARAAVGAAAPVNLNWTVYGGADPYHMVVRQGPQAYDYATGLKDSRNILGAVQDDPYIGIVLSGLAWIELAGIAIFSSETQARR